MVATCVGSAVHQSLEEQELWVYVEHNPEAVTTHSEAACRVTGQLLDCHSQ